MDELLRCAKAFGNLQNIKYHIIVGRKNKLTHINIMFRKWDFHHLMGLGKLKDIRLSKQNRTDVFDDIICGKVNFNTIQKSKYINEIIDRFIPLSFIEQLLDENNMIFRYNSKHNVFSLIQADFLLSTPFNNDDIYIFLVSNNDGNYCCCSFFPRSQLDYTNNQTKYTLLYKEKINLITGESVVQYNKLSNPRSNKS